MKRGLRGRVRQLRVTLWTLIVPPSLWAGHFLFSYLWVSVRCAKLGRYADLPVAYATATVIALVLILAAGWIAWVQSRTPGDTPPHEQSTDRDRLRFIATSTLLLAGLSFVAVIFTATPVIFLTDCR